MKTRKILVVVAMSLLAATAAVSCNSESVIGPVIGYTPSAPTANIPSKGDTSDIKVVANGDWSIREGDIRNATTTLSSGAAGSTEFKIIIDSNVTTEVRKIFIRFMLLTGDSTQGFITWQATQDASVRDTNER